MKKNNLIKLLLTLVTGAIFIVIYYNFNPEKSDYFLPCPIYKFTGFYCTGCGSQRTIHQLLHFQILKAFRYNPLIVVLFPFLSYLAFILLYNFIFDKKIRVKILYNNYFVFIFFFVLLLYTLLRNIPYYPFIYLAPSAS